MEKRKILIIDDEVGFMDIVKINLERTGNYIVRTESDGTKGVAAAKEFQPDLILMDIIMPDISGDEIAILLQKEEDTKNIPVVFLTAVVKKEEEISRGGIIGGKTFIAKPTTVEALIKVIERQLNGS
ncbi:MAG: response regulator [Candidatus Omnitrophica bacterium]|nr:response regulator [Candidatus Omnitrophota bacterium]